MSQSRANVSMDKNRQGFDEDHSQPVAKRWSSWLSFLYQHSVITLDDHSKVGNDTFGSIGTFPLNTNIFDFASCMRLSVSTLSQDLALKNSPSQSSDNAKLFALSIHSVEPSWPIPTSVHMRRKNESFHPALTYSVSMCFYHALSKRFFGSTHVGFDH